MNLNNTEGGNLEVIQLLRFIAAISVVFVHVPTIQGSTWGVDLFFVISGFIMCYATRRSVRSFFLKRLIRVVPIYWILTIGVFSVALWSPNLLNGTTANWDHLVQSLLFIPFDKNGDGHFPVLFLGWTLNYEMLFYLVFAISLKISVAYRSGVTALLLLSVVSLAKIYGVDDENFVAKAWSNPIILEFLLGMLVFLLLFRDEFFLKNTLIVSLCFAIAFYSLDVTSSSRLVSAGLPLAVLFGLSLILFSKVKFHPAIVSLGDASYALYLLHPFVIQYFDKVLKVFEEESEHQNLYSALAIILCILLSVGFFRWIERPITNGLRRLLL